jgi:cell shape-determining protein MreC
MMKKWQLVDEEQLKQMEETQRQIESAKADKEQKQDISLAAKQLQAVSKRLKAQSDLSKIKTMTWNGKYEMTPRITRFNFLLCQLSKMI